VFTPTVRQQIVSSRIDASYQARAHDSVGLFLSQSTLNFEQQSSNAGSLQNTLERNAGLLYRHRLSPHTTIGIDYLLLEIQFGPESQTIVQSAFFSYAQQLSPSLSLSVFGGPQYSRLGEQFSLPLNPSTLQAPFFSTQLNWASGGVLTIRSDKTVFLLTAQRQIFDGGGLLGAVVRSSVEGNMRHRLAGRWDAIWTAGYANNGSLGTTFSQGAYRSLTAGTGLQCSLTEKLALGVRYDFVRQAGTGQSPVFANFDRDLWSVQLSYRFHEIALGQ
jgi:opacity protein-like surface antigen